MTSERQLQKFHIGYASLPRTGVVTRHQNGISTLVSCTSFRWETSGDVAKCWWIFQASQELVQKEGWFLFKLPERKWWKSSSLNGKSLSTSQNNYNQKVWISPSGTLQYFFSLLLQNTVRTLEHWNLLYFNPLPSFLCPSVSCSPWCFCLIFFLFQTKYEEAKKAIAAKGKPLQQKVSLPSTCHLPRGWRFSRVLAYSLALMKLRDYSWSDSTKNPLFPPRLTFLACGNFHARSRIRSPRCNSHFFILLLSANLAVLHWCSDFSHGACIPEC